MIAELVAVAREVSADAERVKAFDPLALYDAVSQNESAVREMGRGVLADIARDLVGAIRQTFAEEWSPMHIDDLRLSSVLANELDVAELQREVRTFLRARQAW